MIIVIIFNKYRRYLPRIIIGPGIAQHQSSNFIIIRMGEQSSVSLTILLGMRRSSLSVRCTNQKG
ncbi:hypothetical protein LQV63_27315 [Paenibacillus profundus]|uniref:Uncharacterized protein n=1 Tax=Paenibacillus profundus TaxID=1173085 RepID=A0ABS8YMB8_9BACL|nr:hypothetical protein [Paenibacillus profundus]